MSERLSRFRDFPNCGELLPVDDEQENRCMFCHNDACRAHRTLLRPLVVDFLHMRDLNLCAVCFACKPFVERTRQTDAPDHIKAAYNKLAQDIHEYIIALYAKAALLKQETEADK